MVSPAERGSRGRSFQDIFDPRREGGSLDEEFDWVDTERKFLRDGEGGSAVLIGCHGVQVLPGAEPASLHQHKHIHLHRYTLTHSLSLPLSPSPSLSPHHLLGQGDHSERTILKLGVERGTGCRAKREHVIDSVVGAQSLRGREIT